MYVFDDAWQARSMDSSVVHKAYVQTAYVHAWQQDTQLSTRETRSCM